MDLIADIGATNSRCALVAADGQTLSARNFRNTEFTALDQLLGAFLDQAASATHPARAALAVAAPVTGDEVVMTNIGWRFEQPALARRLGLDQLLVLNDFEALAHALPRLDAGDAFPCGAGRAVARTPMAVIGPGSGLGVASTVPADGGWIAVAGEGGHVSLPAFDETEAAIIAAHADANGHCSAERLLSGPGLVRIHATLTELRGQPSAALTPAEVTARAVAGEAQAVRCLEIFFAMLGTVAGNLALTVGARGGVFIAGGIVPRLLDAIERSAFRERFVARGRYRDYLDRIPTAVIVAEQPAFIGLKSLLGYGEA